MQFRPDFASFFGMLGAKHPGIAAMSSRIADADHVEAAPRGGMYPEVDLLPNWKRNIAAKSGWIAALSVGAVSVLIVRLVQYHYTGEALIGGSPAITMAVEAGGAIVLSFLAFLLFPYRGLKYVLLLVLGVMGSATAMHNAVHAEPGFFSLLFSEEWTAGVMEATTPNSLYVLGTVIELSPEEEEKVLPTVLRLN